MSEIKPDVETMSAIPPGQRYIDMWAFIGLHPTNFELLKRLKSADDRQFGSNMDVCGTVTEYKTRADSWGDSHIVGIRSDIWKPDHSELHNAIGALQKRRRDHHRRKIKSSGRLSAAESEKLEQKLSADPHMTVGINDIEKRRLVLKLFKSTGQRLRWSGTIEEVTSREVHNSIGSRRALLSMVVILPEYEYLTIIQQNHRTFRIPAVFSFAFLEEAQMRMWHVTVKRKWFSIGADFVIESAGRQIGEIDGKMVGLGYNADVLVTEPTLAKNRHFMDLLTLFASSVGYHRAMRRTVRRCVAAALSEQPHHHLIEDEEYWLLKNPRRRAA